MFESLPQKYMTPADSLSKKLHGSLSPRLAMKLVLVALFSGSFFLLWFLPVTEKKHEPSVTLTIKEVGDDCMLPL